MALHAESGGSYSLAMPDPAPTQSAPTYREMLLISLELHAAANDRIKALEAQLSALRDELRRYVAARVA